MSRAPTLIQRLFPASQTTDDAFIRDGMSGVELLQLRELVRCERPKRVLEIGMANGTSSVMMAEAMYLEHTNGQLTSIDPYQHKPGGYDGAGVRAMKQIPIAHLLIEDFDYVVLPKMVEVEGDAIYDVILIDGFHSFELTFLDLYYADRLLKPGGLLLCHDCSSPAVYKALKWLERNKPYERIGPPIYSRSQSFGGRMWRRLMGGRDRMERKHNWHMLAAYRKICCHAMPEHELKYF